MTNRTSVVADFWLAVARNNHEEAQNAVRRLDVPVVSISSAYSFEMVEGEERLAEVEQEGTGKRVEVCYRGVQGVGLVCRFMDWIYLQFSSGGSPPSP